jgi:hypothetical protein
MFELLKVVVQPVVLERAPDGSIVGERPGDPASLYTEGHVAEFFAAVNSQIAEANATAAASDDAAPDEE